MKHVFEQGYLDSLCGVYSVLNAERLINKSMQEDSQLLFNLIIDYLSRKRMLKDVILDGVNHKVISNIMKDVVADRIPYRQTNKRNFYTVKEWWHFSKLFLEEKENRAIILSIGGRENHLTVIERMTDRRMFLSDSSNMLIIRKSQCVIGYIDREKYVIYPSQTWYLGRE